MTPERQKLLRTLFKNTLLSVMEEDIGTTHNPVRGVWKEMKGQFTDAEIWEGLKTLFPEIDNDLDV